MTVEIESNKNPHEQLRSSQDTQGDRLIVQVDSQTAHSKKAKRDKMNETKIESVESTQAPKLPRKRPKTKVDKKLKKGESRMHRYITEKKTLVQFSF